MVDLTEEEHAAITATLRRMGTLMGEFGWDVRLADLTADQVRALIEEAVERGLPVVWPANWPCLARALSDKTDLR